jgi:CMP-N-acetylneuraminic acid synthetase
MNTIAFIFARGGSKGLPRKNILSMGGKPLLAHAINSAMQVNDISEVFVSTDDDEIAKVAKDYNSKVINRPKELAQDESPEILSWKHAINYIHDKGYICDKFLSLPPTAPLRNSEDIQSCLDLLDDQADLVITITESQRSPFFNMVTLDDNDYVKLFATSDEKYSRRQDAPKNYDITTVAYVARPDYIMDAENLYDGRVKAVYVPRERAIDIDTELDFFIADAMYSRGKNNGSK